MKQPGNYELQERIDAGGMIKVWKACNVHTRKTYALKLLPEDATRDRNFASRFFDEGRVMSDLEHPNIVRVHHEGEADGRYYLVMDLMIFREMAKQGS